MLVLTRRPNQTIWLSNGVEVKVVDTGTCDRNIRLGIEAPHDVIVLRGELLKPAQETDNSTDADERTLIRAIAKLQDRLEQIRRNRAAAPAPVVSAR